MYDVKKDEKSAEPCLAMKWVWILVIVIVLLGTFMLYVYTSNKVQGRIFAKKVIGGGGCGCGVTPPPL